MAKIVFEVRIVFSKLLSTLIFSSMLTKYKPRLSQRPALCSDIEKIVKTARTPPKKPSKIAECPHSCSTSDMFLLVYNLRSSLQLDHYLNFILNFAALNEVWGRPDFSHTYLIQGTVDAQEI
jgi:hypothetical protein